MKSAKMRETLRNEELRDRGSMRSSMRKGGLFGTGVGAVNNSMKKKKTVNEESRRDVHLYSDGDKSKEQVVQGVQRAQGQSKEYEPEAMNQE